MAQERIYDFCIPQAQYLADLVGIRSDLLMVVELTKRFVLLSNQQPPPDRFFKNALCVAALVTYGRTTTSGVRAPIPQSVIESLEPNLTNAHGYFKTLRDRWASHSVNNFEQSRVTVQIRIDDSGQLTPTQISEGHRNTVALSARDMQRLGRLAIELLALIGKEMESEKVRLIEHAKTIDLASLLTNPQAFSRPNDPEKYDKRRTVF